MSHDPIKSDDVPVTQRHLELVRQELKSDITSVQLEMRAGFQLMESRFQAIDGKFAGLDGKFAAIDGKFAGIDGNFAGIDGKFSNIDGRFSDMESRFTRIDSQFLAVDARFERIESILLSMKVLLEEQNSRNRYVLDGYNFIYEKSERSEKRLVRIEKKVFGIEQE